ncbi:uncharacterized protein LOC117241179 [Bombus vosnesenskii]|uniref:Uncharacterized protein LOC117241179 n=1 Tax=Bombus vosnesenskii TaxID=207650 RepID=A0A6J3LEE4_9HYME|nr:uncharacterized protein LOC117241179 [Bombus vosnesenskii]
MFKAVAFADDLAIAYAVKKNGGVSGIVMEIMRTVCDWSEDGHQIGALRGILPNIKGPPGLARRLYYSVWESIIIYGAPVWADAMKYEKDKKIIKRAQRTALCITSTAYRTVSHTALSVLTGNLPIYIKVRMLMGIYERKKIYKNSAVGEEVIERHAEKKEDLEEVKKKASTEWQAERSIYRKRIGKEVDTKCWDCGDPNDDAEHVLFACPKWINRRIEFENFLGVRISVDNLVDTVVTRDKYWRKFREFCKGIMRYRRDMEKAMESANRRGATSTRR